ncbi:hypothetical protein AB0K02_15015 [Streptomyces sp. NPDC049597]
MLHQRSEELPGDIWTAKVAAMVVPAPGAGARLIGAVLHASS